MKKGFPSNKRKFLAITARPSSPSISASSPAKECSNPNSSSPFEPSDLGFASFVPDSTFAVYGLTDEAAENWEENAPTWKSAPAHDGATLTPIADQTRLLGHFQIAQGVNRGTCVVKGPALADFLDSDTNGQVTLIVVRETDETQKSGLVHAFATKEKAKRPPPLLKVRVQ